MINVQAVIFDLHGTLGYVENPLDKNEVSEYLMSEGYEVSPQSLSAAWMYVSFIDYPRYGYRSWRSYFSRILWRLKTRVDEQTLDKVVKLLEQRDTYKLYPDAAEAVVEAKKAGFKTAIATTIAYFKFKTAVRSIKRYLDLVMTGFEAGVDKSNPRMYKKILEILQVPSDQAVMIGDNASLDILLPKTLGMKAILLDREKRHEEWKEADAIVDDLHEALKMIRRRP